MLNVFLLAIFAHNNRQLNGIHHCIFSSWDLFMLVMLSTLSQMRMMAVSIFLVNHHGKVSNYMLCCE